jgi:membrane-bound lytic murein transglycosylase A
VDTNYIPFGAVILAEMPIINSQGQVTGNKWQLLFPQDRGDAIKGPARMDIYTGIGEAARATANSLTGYGRAYLLLSKPQRDHAITT